MTALGLAASLAFGIACLEIGVVLHLHPAAYPVLVRPPPGPCLRQTPSDLTNVPKLAGNTGWQAPTGD